MVYTEKLAKHQNSEDSNSKIKVELAVNLSKQDDLLKIQKALQSKGVRLMSSDLEGKTIQVELNFRADSELNNLSVLQRFIENKTGIITVVKGIGQISSAVTELCPSVSNVANNQSQVLGVLRLSELASGYCLFDGLVEGLNPSNGDLKNHYKLAVHQFGDLSGNSFDQIGKPVIEVEDQITSSNTFSIRRILPNCDVASLIGKSAALTKVISEQSNKDEIVLSAGVIARASTISSNKKQICTCSGKTIWEERTEQRQKEQI